MNLRFKPTAVQAVDNPAADTVFLWFHSVEVDVGIVVEKEDIQKIKDCCVEMEEMFKKVKE